MAVKPMLTEQKNATQAESLPVKPPVKTVLKSLTKEDLKLLDKVITEPVEFIDNPILYESRADVTLLGRSATFVSPNSTHFRAPEPAVPADTARGSTIPTLSVDQEHLLFLRLNYARMRMRRILDAHQGKRLTSRSVRQLLAWAYLALDVRAEIVRMNVPLVLAMAKRTRLSIVDFNELISEGNMALLRSVDKFDCSRGFKFSTYSCRAILKSFSRVAMRASRYRGHFPAEFDPALEADNYLEEKRQGVEGDCVDELKDILVRNLADLSPVERTVIQHRFALDAVDPDTTHPKTLEEVGLVIGVTKERVRQIQNKALRKIRATLEERYLAA